MALYSLCRCGTKITYKTKYCESCNNKYNREKKENKNFFRSNNEVDRLRNTKKWKDEVRDQVLKRANYICELHNYIDKHNPRIGEDVHHINAAHTHPQEFYDLDNLILLCKDCHKYLHEHNIETKEKFKELLMQIKSRGGIIL